MMMPAIENQAKYKTCGCCCNVKICAIIIGVLEGLWFAGMVVNIVNGETGGLPGWIICVVLLLLGIPALICLFIGIAKENGWLVIPHIIFQILYIFFIAGLIITMMVLLGLLREEDRKNNVRVGDEYYGVIIGMMVGLGISILFDIWFLVSIIQCFLYFRAKANVQGHGGMIQMQPTSAPNTYAVPTAKGPGGPPMQTAQPTVGVNYQYQAHMQSAYPVQTTAPGGYPVQGGPVQSMGGPTMYSTATPAPTMYPGQDLKPIS